MQIKKLFGLIIFVVLFCLSFENIGNSIESMTPRKKDKGQVLGVFENNSSQTITQDNSLPINERLSHPKRQKDSPDFDITANSGLVMDESTGDIIISKNSDQSVSIASLTKLMTALVFVGLEPEWDSYYLVKADDMCVGGKNYIVIGEELKIKDLFNLALMASENNATMALVATTGIGENEFIDLMNDKAKDIGLAKTIFVDPVGINDNNVSTAEEIAILVREALKNPFIREATLTKELAVINKQGKSKLIANTDKLLAIFPTNGIEIKGGKTGYTNQAGYCFSAKFTNNEGREIISVIIGDKGPDSRFYSTKKMVSWVYKYFTWE